MTVLGILVKACGIALLMGALLGAFAWNGLDEPRRSAILAQARWLAMSGYVGIFLWAAIFGFGVLAWGCDPLFGGWVRTPLFPNVITSEILSCRETQLQARGKPELRAQFPDLPEYWSQVYRHYDEVADVPSDTGSVWIAYVDGSVHQIPKARLEFRPVPQRRGIPWWQPQEASESW